MIQTSGSAKGIGSPVGWVDRLAPAAARPWLRLARADSPVGYWLLMWPCWWSVALASPSWPDPGLLLLFLAGAVVMRAAGCTVNDLIDRDFDARVARTRTRPLASGAISPAGALAFLALLLLAGLAILTRFDRAAVLVGSASLGLVAVYPLMKRVTYWPQLFLGLTFNWGALVGWAAVRDALHTPALLLYGAAICWTIGYDTLYAHQDKADDRRLGLKSTALAFGDRTPVIVAGFYLVFLAGLVAAGLTAALAWPFHALLALAACHLAWQVLTVDIDEPGSCHERFLANVPLGALIFVAIVLGRVTG